jgi:anti-anti-sigma regulatory factor
MAASLGHGFVSSAFSARHAHGVAPRKSDGGQRTMLRITTHHTPELLTFQLEGRLAGPWVVEVQDCWQRTAAGRGDAAVRFDLTGVTYVDAAGKEFLLAMHEQGSEFVASGCLMRAIVAEIARRSSKHANQEDRDEREHDDCG